MTLTSIQRDAASRGITRLCHFTPSRNLAHISAGGVGVLATTHLKNDERAVYNPTDLERLDQHPEYVCCSVEYPNGWYFRKARERELLFKDWVVLLLSPKHLWREGTLFSPRNAAAGYGANLRAGGDAYERLFAPVVVGTGGRRYERGGAHPAYLPTDDQAEVLVPDAIPREDIVAVAVRDVNQAADEAARLRLAGLAGFEFVVAPMFFEPSRLSATIRQGARPVEVPWAPNHVGDQGA